MKTLLLVIIAISLTSKANAHLCHEAAPSVFTLLTLKLKAIARSKYPEQDPIQLYQRSDLCNLPNVSKQIREIYLEKQELCKKSNANLDDLRDTFEQISPDLSEEKPFTKEMISIESMSEVLQQFCITVTDGESKRCKNNELTSAILRSTVPVKGGMDLSAGLACPIAQKILNDTIAQACICPKKSLPKGRP